MNDIISLEQWRREREHRRIAPQLRQVARLREMARKLMLEAEVIEAEVYGLVDYELIGDPRCESSDAS